MSNDVINQAYRRGFTSAVMSSNLSAIEKVAFLQEQPGGMPPDGGGLPEGQDVEAELMQLLQAMPGETEEEKVQALMQVMQQIQGGGEPGLDQELPPGGEEQPLM